MPSKKLLMASSTQVLEDYIARRNLNREEYLFVVNAREFNLLAKDQEITLVLTECDWQAERALRDMAISRGMIITETYG